MSNYSKITDFAAKDALASGNPLKRITGTGIDNEFVAIQTAIATKADLNSPTFTGTPSAPQPAIGVAPDAQVATVKFVEDSVAAGFPIGGIIMWGGTAGAYPAGWQLCDGSTVPRSDGAGNITVPDLRDRFIVAAGTTRAEQTTGGTDTHNHSGNTGVAGAHSHGGATGATTLTIDQIPSHTHNTNTPNEFALNNTAGGGNSSDGLNGLGKHAVTSAAGGGQSHDHTITAAADHAHTISTANNVPAYYALAFLCKV